MEHYREGYSCSSFSFASAHCACGHDLLKSPTSDALGIAALQFLPRVVPLLLALGISDTFPAHAHIHSTVKLISDEKNGN